MSAVGRGLGTGIEAAGEVYDKYETHKEVGHGSAVASDMLVNLDDQWNQTIKSADPNDPSVRQKFMEEVVKPTLDKFQNGDETGHTFTTEDSQKFAQGIVDRYYQHFATKTASDMSTMAGIAARENAQRTISGLSSAVYSDPSSLGTALDTLDHASGHIVSSSPTMDAETSARVKADLDLTGKKAIVKSAVLGAIAKNPNVDIDAFAKQYPEYIDGAELKMFQKSQQTQARVNAAYDRQALIQQKQLADLNVHKQATDIISKGVSIDPTTGQPIVSKDYFKAALDIARNNPDAPSAAATARTMLDWGESQQNKERKVADDPVTLRTLSDRLFDPTNPTTELDLMRAQTDGKLSDHSFQQLRGMVKEMQATPLKGPVFQDTMKAVHSTLNLVGTQGFSDTKDPIGDRNYASFVQSFVPQYLAKSRAGTLPPNALDLNDPKSFISQTLAPFRNRSMQSDLQTTAAQPEAAPAKSGKPELPFALRGIADISYSKSRNMWRDNTSGKLYNAQGEEVGK